MQRIWVLLLALVPYLTTYSTERKVYDCFMFFNELDLLEIKLHELYDVVDYFVIVESVETFKGAEKPLYFLNHQQRFERFADKIIYLVDSTRRITDNPWDREEAQRDKIMEALVACKEEDIIIIEDADEIVRSEIIPLSLNWLGSGSYPALACAQEEHLWFINTYDKPSYPRYHWQWPGSVISTYRLLKQLGPNKLRSYRDVWPRISQAGWHFSYLGGAQCIVEKVRSFSHTEEEFLAAFHRSPEAIVSERDNLYIVPIDASYPRLIQEQAARFEQMGWILD